MAIYLIY